MLFASLVEIPVRCISPSLWERLQLHCLVPPIPRAMAPTVLSIPAPSLAPISFFAVRGQSLPISEASKPIHPCWNWKWKQSSKLCADRSRPAHERHHCVLRALARPPWLSARHCRSVFCPSYAAQHFGRRAGGRDWLVAARLCRWISSQAGSPHGHRSLRLHTESALSRQRHSYCRGRHRRTLLDFRRDFVRLFRTVLLHRHAAGGEGALSPSWGCLRAVRASCPTFHPSSDRRQSASSLCGFVYSRAVQEKPRMASRGRLPISSRRLASDLVSPHALRYLYRFLLPDIPQSSKS